MQQPYQPLLFDRMAHARSRVACFRRITQTVTALGGVVYGSCVRDTLLMARGIGDTSSDSTLRNNIHCHFNQERAVQQLMRILCIDFEVVVQPPNNNDVVLSVASRLCRFASTLHVSTLETKLLRLQPCAMDVNGLAMNSNGVFLWPTSPAWTMLTATSVMQCITSKRFRLVSLSRDATPAEVCAAIRDYVELTDLGWEVLPDSCGATSLPFTIIAPATQQATEHKPDADASCAICQEAISGVCGLRATAASSPNTQKRTVVQLRCQHIFHGACISKWLEDAVTCPCCRWVVAQHRYRTGS